MKTLILIRHAKSSWDVPVSDKDRELILSGIKNIKSVATMAKSMLPKNFIIWSSTAKRAMQTATIFCETASIQTKNIIYKDGLYTFNANDLHQIISKCDNQISDLIIFGHNSAITDFANHFGDQYIDNVPTAGFVLLNFNEKNWANITKGKIIKTIFPKEI
jgi:phosphohistidine phosphatase